MSGSGGWGGWDSGPGQRLPAARGRGARREFGATWWGRAWVAALEGRGALDRGRLSRGRSYARSGAVGSLTVEAGAVHASVQGSRALPYATTVEVAVFSPAQWGRVLDVVAGELGHTAALLDGELPPEVVADVESAGLDLLPGPGDLLPQCSCPDWGDPCKHAAALCYLVADELDRDPFAVLMLRGMARDDVLAALRSRRSGASRSRPRRAPALDDGVDASAAFTASTSPRPRLPTTPATPGAPAVLPVDPPPESGVTGSSLAALAEDAAGRALALLSGDGGPALSAREDLARRSAALLGTPSLAAVAGRAGLGTRALEADARAWSLGGREGLAVEAAPWSPASEEVAEGVVAVEIHAGGRATVRGNRVTRGDVQLRLGHDGLWYPMQRHGAGWRLAGPGSADPGVALTRQA